MFRVEVPSELESGHSLDELARIIAVSGQEGSFSGMQTQLLRRAVELGNSRAGEVMVPRPDVVWMDVDDSLADLRARRREHRPQPVPGPGRVGRGGPRHRPRQGPAARPG